MSDNSNYVVTIARYGTRTTVRSDVFLNHHLYAEPDAEIGMDYFFWVAQNNDRTVVIDTGFSEEGGENRQRTMLVHPIDLLSQIGVDAQTVSDVVVTHAHYDHIGNLSSFPTARIHIAAAELDFWQGPHAQKPLFHHSVEDSELEQLSAAAEAGQVEPFSGRKSLAPGIEIIELGGHTPGQSVVLVSTSEGTVLLASDAAHYYEEVESAMPFTSVADLIAMYDGFDTIRSMLDSGEAAHLVSGHDPDTLSRFKRADGPLGEHISTIGKDPHDTGI